MKVARHISGCLDEQQINHTVVDLFELNLPIFGTQGVADWQARLEAVLANFKKANGVVLISPEYNGGPSPAVLNLMLYVKNQLAHKPVLTVGVSAGRGGAYPLAALRQNGFKDTAYVIIPESVIVSHVHDVLNEVNGELTDTDRQLRTQLQQALSMLTAYAIALQDLDL